VNDESVVERYFAAMRKGAAAEDELLALFAADAVYIEPFISDGPAVGVDAIRDRFRRGWENPLPDLELDVRSIEVDGPLATSSWECRSPALPGPVQGEDRYEIRDGKIVRLEVRLLGDA
jgi:hypothetical protein